MIKERILGLIVFSAIIIGLIYINVNQSNRPSDEDILMGWIRISNAIGRTGAIIYSDREDPNLLDSMQFTNQPEPATVIEVAYLLPFLNSIEESGVHVVYRHGDSLILIKDPSTWVKYTPRFRLSV